MAGFTNPLTQNIPTKDPSKGNIIRKVVKGPNGLQIQFVDPFTNQIVQNPAEYNIVDPQIADIESLGLTANIPSDDSKPEDQPKDSGSVQNNPDPTYIPPNQDGGRDLGSYKSSGSRSEANNYGYIDKPGFLGMASNLPGVAGLIGKGVNAAINANNVGAVNSARDAMDVPDLTGRQTLGGILRDRQGHVANVDITNQLGQVNDYSVGLEALSPKGGTNLTPEEARMRAMANPANIKLSEDQKPHAASVVEKERGILRSFIDSLFDDDVETVERSGVTVAKEKSGDGYDHFPDAPDAPTSGRGFSSIKDTKHSQERERDTSLNGRSADGLSDTARGDIDRGAGGLY